jgi:hypothetical protein
MKEDLTKLIMQSYDKGVKDALDSVKDALDSVKEALAQERNFCSRCGKRTADLTVIHTCTPPQENT